MAVRSSRGMKTSVARVITTSAPSSSRMSRCRRRATSSTRSFSWRPPRPRVPGSWPPWPASMTMLARAQAELAGQAVGAGAVDLRGGQRRHGAGGARGAARRAVAAAARPPRRGGPARASATADGIGAPAGAGDGARRASGRVPRRHAERRGAGSVSGAGPRAAGRAARGLGPRRGGGRRVAAGTLPRAPHVHHQAHRVLEVEDRVVLHVLEVEDHAHDVVLVLRRCGSSPAGRRPRGRCGRRRFGCRRVPSRSTQSRSGSAMRS